MKLHILALLLVLFSIGCGSNVNPSATSPRSYNGTASVGDFLTITLDPAAHTLTYKNLSNLDSGIIPYSVNSDGRLERSHGKSHRSLRGPQLRSPPASDENWPQP